MSKLIYDPGDNWEGGALTSGKALGQLSTDPSQNRVNESLSVREHTISNELRSLVPIPGNVNRLTS